MILFVRNFLLRGSLLDHLARSLEVGDLLLEAGLLLFKVGDHRLHVRLALLKKANHLKIENQIHNTLINGRKSGLVVSELDS
jgi:hypothetical protein